LDVGTQGAVSVPMAASVASHPFVKPIAPPVAQEPRILALAFDSQQLAHQALQAAMGLRDDEALDLHDAVMLTSDRAGTATVAATMDPTPVAAAVPASLFGALVGTLIAGPIGLLIGGALGGGGGALAARLVDTGMPSYAIDALRETVIPGQYVLALLVTERRAGTLASFAMRCGTLGRSTILPCY
jgi:uncharacterized membrane protein